MSTVCSAATFLEIARKSNIISEDRLTELLQSQQQNGRSESDGNALARWLVRRGYLTPFQAQQLLAGKHKNFFINRKYLILEPLGTGGMGAVYRCRHLMLQKDVALKFLPGKLTSDPSALQRFLREARALAALDHPNIVRAHDCDESQGRYFLVMAYVEGITLQQMVERHGPLPVPQAAYYVAQACAGLQHAHQAGWVHRDLKPSNLVVDSTDTVKLLDLGLARMLTDPGEPITKMYDEDSILGSPDYLSPEQSLNSPDIDIRSDIYSLGATLYYLLAGKPPYDGLALMQKLLAHQMQEPPALELFRSDVPPELSRVIRCMMAKSPDQRFATPGEVADVLLTWAEEYHSSASPTARSELTELSPPRRTTPATSVAREHDPLFTDSNAGEQRSGGPAQFTPTMMQETHRPLTPTTQVFPTASTMPPAVTETPDDAEEQATALPHTLITGRVIGGFALCLFLLAGAVCGAVWLAGDRRPNSDADPSEHPVLRVERLCRQKRWQEAAHLYAQLLNEAGPESTRGKELFTHMRVKERQEVLPFMAALLPENNAIQFNAGFWHMEKKEYTKALGYFTTITEREDAKATTWYNKSLCEIHLNRLEAALKSINQAAALQPKEAHYHGGAILLMMMLRKEEEGRQRCLEILPLLEATKDDADLAVACFACCQCNLTRDQLAKVKDGAQRLVEKNSKYGRYLFLLGLVHYRMGNHALALEAFTAADATTQTWSGRKAMEPARAMTLHRLGRREEAKRVLTDLQRWRSETMAKLPKDDSSYLTICWDMLVLENLLRQAENILRF